MYFYPSTYEPSLGHIYPCVLNSLKWVHVWSVGDVGRRPHKIFSVKPHHAPRASAIWILNLAFVSGDVFCRKAEPWSKAEATVGWQHSWEEWFAEGCRMMKAVSKAPSASRAPSMLEAGVRRRCGTRHMSTNDRPRVEMFINHNDCNNPVIVYTVWDPRWLGVVWTMFIAP
jgi:hypothetical protein